MRERRYCVDCGKCLNIQINDGTYWCNNCDEDFDIKTTLNKRERNKNFANSRNLEDNGE